LFSYIFAFDTSLQPLLITTTLHKIFNLISRNRVSIVVGYLSYFKKYKYL
jgi:hypothetical protein